MKKILILVCMIWGLSPLQLHAKLKVVTSVPSIKWATKMIGGNLVEVESLLQGNEDPHYVDALPSFVFKAANADILCFVGLDLEVGWLPKVLKKSRNTKIQEGGKGYCDLGSRVKPLGVKKGPIDRSMGDVHGLGNPHYHLGPLAFYGASSKILDTLINSDPKNAQTYLKNYAKLKQKIHEVIKKVQAELSPVRSKSFVEYHQEFTYFFREFGLKNEFAIETVPGVAPSAGRLAKTALKAKSKKVNLVIGSILSPKQVLKKFQEFSGVPFVQLPSIMSAEGELSDYETYMISMAKKIRAKSE